MKAWILVALALIVGLAAGVGTALLRVQMTAPDTEAMLAGQSGTGRFALPGEPRPKVVIDETSFDFGAMGDDATNSHSFIFRNEGDGTLTLTKGDTTCRCTLIDLEQTDIPPGESAAVKVQWNAKNLAGPYRQSATIFTNDPDRSRVTLTITGRITAALRVTPSDLVFSHLSVGEPATGEVRLYSYLPQKLQITGHKLKDRESAEHFEVAYRPLASDQLKDEPDVKSGCLVTISVKSGLPLGAFRQTILLTTNLKDSPTVEIPVEGTVDSDISIIGRGWNDKNGVLRIGTVSSRQGAEQTVTLACRGSYSKEVTYKVAHVTPSLLKVELGKRADRNQGKVSLTPLTIQIPKGSHPANHLGSEQGDLGRITIETNHPQAPQLRILVRFAVEG